MTNLVSYYILTNVTTEHNRVGRIRKTAEERREEILDAAVTEFAARGLRGASVEEMADSVGVSQPYVYRLFGTKKDLFLAAARHVRDRVSETFRKAAEANPDNPLEAMGRSYGAPLFRREEMMMLLQGFAASEDPEVREAIGSGFAELWRSVEDASGASEEQIWNFMATGMMLTIDAAIGLMPRLGKEDWLREHLRAGPRS